ncbi:MAG: phosphoribosylamine--glycine ligase, partial [Devosiaceae bacterium]|nr:phosphoribosylamine--glycine ligase [Devosiaceae bacterium MH13]
ALRRSPSVDHVWCAPGNGGIEGSVDLDLEDFEAVTDFCAIEAIDLVVVGPEAPLVAGLVDDLEASGTLAFGPSQEAAQLEGSKAYTKALCDEAGIPTAAYAAFDTETDALAYLETQGAPIVIKADGLAAGKGVTVAETLEDARAAVSACFDGAFGAAGARMVMEECLVGEEASLFALCDGETAVFFGAAQDHKRVGDGDTGPNTGGMGAYSPAPIMDDAMVARVMAEIVEPALKGMAARGTPFKGVLFAGLMITAAGPKLIEFNTRFGDPECQALLMRFAGDLGEVLLAGAQGNLATAKMPFHDDHAMTVVMATQGYPGSYEKGSVIANLPSEDPNMMIFHAGTSRDDDGTFRATGGRVLGVTARGSTLGEARDRAYAAVAQIDWPEGFCRQDIGWRALTKG